MVYDSAVELKPEPEMDGREYAVDYQRIDNDSGRLKMDLPKQDTINFEHFNIPLRIVNIDHDFGGLDFMDTTRVEASISFGGGVCRTDLGGAVYGVKMKNRDDGCEFQITTDNWKYFGMFPQHDYTIRLNNTMSVHYSAVAQYLNGEAARVPAKDNDKGLER